MKYKVKVAVCSKICTNQWTQSEHHVELFIVKPGGTYITPLGFNPLNAKLNAIYLHYHIYLHY
jgi:hypothetical protein